MKEESDMKKVLAIAIIGGVAASAALAGPMGPVKPTQGRWGLEFEVSADQRDMEASGNRANKRENDMLNFLGRASYGLTDKVEVSVRLGGADLEIEDKADVNTTVTQYDGKSEFAWGVAIGAILYDAGTWNIGVSGNYLSHSGHAGSGSFTGGSTANDIDYADWNIGGQLQGKYDQFLPYVGIKYSDARTSYNSVAGAAAADDEADDNFGVYIGAGWDLSPQWSGYFEGRFVDETSFGGGVRYTF